MEDSIRGETSEARTRLRHALTALAPKGAERKDGTTTYPTPITVARAVTRLVGGDELFQYFTREQAAQSKVAKKIMTEIHPNLCRVITAVIVHNANCGLDDALAAFGRHLSKCGDRTKSKRQRDSMGGEHKETQGDYVAPAKMPRTETDYDEDSE